MLKAVETERLHSDYANAEILLAWLQITGKVNYNNKAYHSLQDILQITAEWGTDENGNTHVAWKGIVSQ